MPQHYTRRELLRWSSGSLLAAGLWPGVLLAEDKPKGDAFSFLVVNDIHHLDEKGQPWLAALIKQMRGHAEKPEFLLLVGDLAENGKAAELGPVRDACKDLGLPVYQVIGNHDHTQKHERQAFVELFPQRLNYRFEHRGWQFIGIDSSEGARSMVTVQPETLRWLEENAPKLDKSMPTVLFTHFPLGPMTPARPANADRVLEPLKEVNLQAVFNGHFHGFTERSVKQATFTTNRCCSFFKNNHDGTKEKGYFLCLAKDGKVSRQFIEMKPLPKA
jgi:3',5'-cyclic AMP phosphodiesterase CpdA